jgi:hypothetical protein
LTVISHPAPRLQRWGKASITFLTNEIVDLRSLGYFAEHIDPCAREDFWFSTSLNQGEPGVRIADSGKDRTGRAWWSINTTGGATC